MKKLENEILFVRILDLTVTALVKRLKFSGFQSNWIRKPDMISSRLSFNPSNSSVLHNKVFFTPSKILSVEREPA